mmetsp:Transcript_111173/g.192834  ORF Transcript_111173/g.192834 Transcript_111173/m.192834 type:complete len:80 (+) Transcript_111173:178-417(+)
MVVQNSEKISRKKKPTWYTPIPHPHQSPTPVQVWRVQEHCSAAVVGPTTSQHMLDNIGSPRWSPGSTKEENNVPASAVM